MGRKLTKIVSPAITIESNVNIISNYLVCMYIEKIRN